MSFLFGSGQGRRKDPFYEEAAHSQRMHMARDINDERTLRGETEPHIRRRRTPWVLLAIAVGFLVLVATGVFRRDAEVNLPPNCGEAGIAADSARVPIGAPLLFRAAGPDSGTYAVTIDTSAYESGMSAEDGALAGEFRMSGCLSDTFVATAPTEPGPHTLRLLHRPAGESDDSAYSVAAEITLTLTG